MNEDKGILLAFITALVSGISVFINGFTVKGFDPVVFTALKAACVALALLSAAALVGRAKELSRLSVNQWKWLVVIGLVGGSIPFLLFFQGLSLIAPLKGSFLFRLLFIFSAVFAFFVLREKPSRKAALGAGIVLAGNVLLLGNEGIFPLGIGEMLVLAATAIWAFEYVLSKWAMENRGIEPQILAFGRMFFGGAAIFGYVAATGKLAGIASLSLVHWQWVLITSAFLLLFVTSWYAGLRHAKASTATAILTLGGPITAALNFLFLGKAPTLFEGVGLLLITAGIAAIVGISQIAKLPATAAIELGKFLRRAG